jgi:hypothetical protein
MGRAFAWLANHFVLSSTTLEVVQQPLAAVPDDYDDHLVGRSTTDNSGSAACLHIAREMLGTCLATHDKCNG